MTQDEILKIADEVYGEYDWPQSVIDNILTFAKLVDAKATAREREACAELCENSEIEGSMGYGQICADIIRSRGVNK